MDPESVRSPRTISTLEPKLGRPCGIAGKNPDAIPKVTQQPGGVKPGGSGAPDDQDELTGHVTVDEGKGSLRLANARHQQRAWRLMLREMLICTSAA